ncbi:MAG: hypothetical protein OEZ34_00355 [Spirochaetia bacterium]|nr:hypothetical protein [Spirochaetia bacterium]
MKINNIIEEYIENPENVYDKMSSLDERSRKIVFLLEEVFAGLKFSNIDEVQDEQLIAEIADKLRKGEMTGKINLQDIQAVTDVVGSLKLMSHPERKEVPEVLMSVIERTQNIMNKKKVPSFIVQMKENGIKAILSGLNGMNLVPAAVPVMRSSATMEQETSSLVIEQTLDNGKISYSIVKESSADVMLTLNFSDKIGRCRVFLKENDRIIYTENLEDGEDSVSFRQLKPGYYDISISGSINHDFSILVDG